MQTARDFLVKENLAKPGRGKFSNEAKERLKQAIADGHRFSDWDENGRIAVSPAVKNRIEKRADTVEIVSDDSDVEPVMEVKRKPLPKYTRYRDETEIVFIHPKWGHEIVIDHVGTTPVWAAEKIEIPAWLEGYEWTLR